MTTITKEDVIKAFQNKTGKRNYLLYHFYKEAYFSSDLPASFIAEKISEDLGMPITRTMIYMIIHRIIKKQKSLAASLPSAPPTSPIEPVQVPKITEAENKPPIKKVPVPEKGKGQYVSYTEEDTMNMYPELNTPRKGPLDHLDI